MTGQQFLHDPICTESANMYILPEDTVIVQQGWYPAILLQYDRVALASGEEGNSQPPLPAEVPAAEGESEV